VNTITKSNAFTVLTYEEIEEGEKSDCTVIS
jgi:hypothetical protein